MRLRTKVGVVFLGGAMVLAGWDLVRGRAPEDLMERTQDAFIVRASMHGCDDPQRTTLAIDRSYTTHYGVEYPTPAKFARCGQKVFEKRYGGWFADRIHVELAGEPEAISFPSGGAGCYDNLFIPLRVEMESDWGPTIAFPIVARVTQRLAGSSGTVFVGPEVTGWFHDDGLPPRKRRGSVGDDGVVPSAWVDADPSP
jgi:hypothetical protein